MKFSVPVSPYVGTIRGEDDVVFSLVDLAPTKDIRLKLPPGPLKLTEAHLTYASVSIETMADLGITSAVTVTNKFSGKLACFNVELLATAKVPNQLTGGLIEEAVVGVGFRIGVIGFNFKDESKVATPALLAASSTLNMSSSLFEVAVMGAGLEALPAVKPLLLASINAFDVSTFQTLGSVQVALNDYIVDNVGSLTPVLLAVAIDAPRFTDVLYPAGTRDFKADALAQTYAFERVYHNASEDEALADPRVKDYGLHQALITYVYETLLGLERSQKPTAAAKAEADRVLRAGR